jgi:hypothetical protein
MAKPDRLRQLLRQQKDDQCHQQAGYQRFQLHPARLSSHLRQFFPVFDRFDFRAELARTSRRKSHSGLVAPLEEAGGRPKEDGQKEQSPQGLDTAGKQSGQDGQADDEHDQAARKPFAPLPRADVGDTDFTHRWFHGMHDITSSQPKVVA